ncbi:hypothetical protein [uncultured Methanobrevibacter sp.]|uniref:hypothetical protein n=1 Tax=uncultured Methanobrevibacter sp. TaxID=253161 RepID=UPI0025D21001|nr:hypothetical protein [uncultured Methanobrevibacter sp.]
MTMIEYDAADYEILETEVMGDELGFKLVKFSSGFYGVVSYNPLTNDEKVTLVSPEKDINKDFCFIFGGLGCKSFIVFARDAKKYLDNAPRELVVQLGQDAPDEYREVITKDQEKTLFEKVEICHEIMVMKLDESYHLKDILSTILMCAVIIVLFIAMVNSLHLWGVI